MGIIVQKYGGSSLADAEKIKNVAATRRQAARSRATRWSSSCPRWARRRTSSSTSRTSSTTAPEDREMDVLMSTGETVSSTLMVMALHAMGHDAISLSGGQAGIRTDKVHRKARIMSIEPKRVHAGARRRPHRHRRRLPGADAGRRQRHHDARSRRLRHHGRRPRRRPRGRRLRDLHRRRRRLHRRPAHRAGRAQARRDQLRRDAGAGERGREGDALARRRGRRRLQHTDTGRFQLQGGERHPYSRRCLNGAVQEGARHRPRPRRGQGHRPSRPRPAGDRGGDLRAADGGARIGRHHRPERQRREAHRPHVHRLPHRPAQGPLRHREDGEGDRRAARSSATRSWAR